jgi:nitroreductase
MGDLDVRADLFEIMYTCRAMRRLKPNPVGEDTLVKLIDAAIQAPTAADARTWRFIVVRDPNIKEQIGREWRRGWSWYLEAAIHAPLRPWEDAGKRERLLKAATELIDGLRDVPALICVCIARDELAERAARRPSVIASIFRHLGPWHSLRLILRSREYLNNVRLASAYPAVQNLLLAARALGLGAVITTPQIYTAPRTFERILEMPRSLNLTALVPVGYPKGKFGPTARPHPRDVISWDRYAAS